MPEDMQHIRIIVTCPECGAEMEVEGNVTFCTQCGADIRAIVERERGGLGYSRFADGGDDAYASPDELEQADTGIEKDGGLALLGAASDEDTGVEGVPREEDDSQRDSAALNWEPRGLSASELPSASARSVSGSGVGVGFDGASEHRTTDEDDRCPASVEYNKALLHVKETESNVRFRITNTSGRLLEDVCLELRAFGRTSRDSRLELRPGRVWHPMFRLVPTSNGRPPVSATLRCCAEEGGERSWRSSFEIVVMDRRSEQGTAGFAGSILKDVKEIYGSELTIHIGQDALRQTNSYEQLVQLEIAPIFQQLHMESYGGRLPSGVLLGDCRGVPPRNSLALVLGGLPVRKTYLLLSEDPVDIGRYRGYSEQHGRMNHIVTQLVCDDPKEQRKRSISISRFHARLRIAQNYALFTNISDKYGTTVVDGRTLGHMEHVELPQRGTISLGGSLDLGYTVFSEDAYETPQQSYVTTVGLMDICGFGKVSAVRLRRLNNAAEEEYIILAKCAAIGSSEECAIKIPGASLGPAHLRLVRHRARYWIRSHRGYDAWIERAGRRRGLSSQRAVPLSVGDRIHLAADVYLDVQPYQQSTIGQTVRGD